MGTDARAATNTAIPAPATALAAGPSGGAWFADGAHVGLISASGTIRESATSTDVGALAAEPDGAAAFLGSSGSEVGAVAPDGGVSESALMLPSADAARAIAAVAGVTYLGLGPGGGGVAATGPGLLAVDLATGATTPVDGGAIEAADDITALAAGAQGALWLVGEPNGVASPVVWYLTAGGAVTRFAPGHEIDQVAVDGDGRLWFTDVSDDLLGRLSPTGALKLFTRGVSPAVSSAPDAIAPGPAASMWFTRLDGSLARISAAGKVTTIVRGLPDEGDNLAAASSGGLWLTENGNAGLRSGAPAGLGGHLARVTPSGAVNYFPRQPGCRVPDVRGEDVDYASDQLAIAECAPGAVQRRGRGGHLVVLAQSPSPGSTIAFQAPVALVLGPAPPPPHGCRAPEFDPVIASDAQGLLVWEQITGDPDDSSQTSTTRVVACARPDGARHTIHSYTQYAIQDSESLSQVQWAGLVVGFVVGSGSQYGFDQTIEGFDARDGRTLFSVSATSETYGSAASEQLSTYALDAGGDVAWVEVAQQDGATVDTLLLCHAGRTRTLDSGPAIGSPAFEGKRLNWISGDQLRSVEV